MEWVNKWNNQTILSNAIRSCNNAIQDFQSIIQRCSRFQIVKQKEENCFRMLTLARMKNLNILVTKIWLRSVFENWQNYLVKIADFWSNIIKEKNGNHFHLFSVMKNLCGTPFSKYTGKKLSNHLLKNKIQGFGCKMGVIIKMKTKLFWRLQTIWVTLEYWTYPPKKLQSFRQNR